MPLCIVSRHAITLKELEYSLNVEEYPFQNNQGICQTTEKVMNTIKKDIDNQMLCI